MNYYHIVLSQTGFLQQLQNFSRLEVADMETLADDSSGNFYVLDKFLKRFPNNSVQIATNIVLIRTNEGIEVIRATLLPIMQAGDEVFISAFQPEDFLFSTDSKLRFELEYLLEK